MNAVTRKMTLWGMGIAAATASLALFVATAGAQTQPAPKAPAPAAPAAKAPAAPAPAAKPAADKKKGSACKGLDEAACKANADCTYIVPTKANKATGKVQAAYCKTAPKPKAKKAEAAPKSPAPAPAPAKKP